MNVVLFAPTLRHLRFVSALSVCQNIPGIRICTVLADRQWNRLDETEAWELLVAISACAEVADLSIQTRDDVFAHFVQRCHFIFFTHRNDPVSTFEVFRRAEAHVPVPVQEDGLRKQLRGGVRDTPR